MFNKLEYGKKMQSLWLQSLFLTSTSQPSTMSREGSSEKLAKSILYSQKNCKNLT